MGRPDPLLPVGVGEQGVARELGPPNPHRAPICGHALGVGWIEAASLGRGLEAETGQGAPHL